MKEECAVSGGHQRAAVAGTGDVVAGIAASIYAQTKEPMKSAKAACIVAKRAAESLSKQLHFGYTASDMIYATPQAMKELRVFRVTTYKPSKA